MQIAWQDRYKEQSNIGISSYGAMFCGIFLWLSNGDCFILTFRSVIVLNFGLK